MRLPARLSAPPRPLRSALAAVALGGLYLLVAYLSSERWPTETALLWPASGLYVGVLLASDRRSWPHLALGVLLGSLGANLLAGNSPAVSLGFAVPSCAEGLLGAVLVRRLVSDRFTLTRVRDVAALIGGAAILANGMTALSAAATAMQSFDTAFGDSWLRWWTADALGIAAVAPIAVLLLRGPLARPPRDQLDQLALSLVLLAGIVVFFSMADPPVAAAVVAGAFTLPILASAAWRWSVPPVALVTPVVAVALTYIASRQTLGATSISSSEMLTVQAFLGTLIVATLSLGAASAEHQGSEKALRRTRARFRRLVETSPDAYVSIDADGRIDEWSPQAETIFGWTRGEVLGRDLPELLAPPAHLAAWREALKPRAEGSADDQPGRLIAAHRSGDELPIELTSSAGAPEDSPSLQLFIRDVSERERARHDLLEARVEIDRRQEELNDADERIERLSDEIRRRSQELEEAAAQQARLQAELERSEGDRQEVLRRLTEAQDAIAAREGDLGSLREDLATADAERQEAARARDALQAELERIEQKLAAAERGSEELRRQLDALREEHARNRAKLQEAEAAAAAAKTALAESDDQFAAERVRLEQAVAERDERLAGEDARLEWAVGEREERLAEEREQLERALGEREERLAEVDAERSLLARRSRDLIARYDARGVCLYASPACRELLGHEPEELVARQGAELLHRDDLPLLNRARAAVGDTTFRARLRRKDGSLTDVEATFAPIRDPETGELKEIEASLRRAPAGQAHVQERVEAPAELRPLSDRDALTGLFSRARFEEELRTQVAAATRYETRGAVLAVDIDRFRELNGLLGHSCTDDLLRGVADAFRERLRTTDVLGRTGDDQFAVILPRARDAQSADVASALLDAVREVGATELGTGPLRLTASVGIACFGKGRPVRAEELLVEAEIAVQDAKQSGGDSAAVYDGSEDWPVSAGEQFGWAEQIRSALAEDRFVLHAQRVVSLAGDPLVRHELLPRMIGAGGETIPPAAFLPAAARLGLSGEVDRWLLRRAIAVLAREQRAGGDPRFEVALSAQAPPDAELATFVAGELRSAGADARGLSLTIPETSALRAGGTAGLALRRLTDLGCEVGLGAFGTGLASFLHVEGLPVSYLKLDEDLVKRLGGSHGARLVVRSVASIARTLGRRTVARSVPDRETLLMLRRLGVGYAQGPALAEPRPATELRLSHPPEVLIA